MIKFKYYYGMVNTTHISPKTSKRFENFSAPANKMFERQANSKTELRNILINDIEYILNTFDNQGGFKDKKSHPLTNIFKD
jgi:hypothetical protein